MQIQSLESPKFDYPFAMFGSFHLFIAFFSALGKIVSESGLTHILCESGVLAENSVNGFISGRHFNRCQSLHTLFALALKLQHIKCFISNSDVTVPPMLQEFLLNCYQHPDWFTTAKFPKDIEQFFAEYEKFCSRSRQGEQGATAQLWINYIDLVFLFLNMSRAVRLNDIDLFTYMLPMMTSIFYMAGLDEKEDVSNELKKSRIARDNNDLHAITEVIEGSANPFHTSLKNEVLHNIGSGKSASSKTQEYLLKIMEKIDTLRRQFIDESKRNPQRFEEPIKNSLLKRKESRLESKVLKTK